MPEDTGYHLLEHLGIPPQQFQASFAWLLPDTCRDDHYFTIGQVRIISCFDLQRVCKWNGMQDIVGFRLGPRFILIDQHDPASYPAHHQRVSGSCADETTSNDASIHQAS